MGQSLILFANRVKPRRFAASLLLSALLYLAGFGWWSLSIWLVARYGFGRPEPYEAVMRSLGLAYSPYLFSFFILTPYLGSFISVALSVWTLLAILLTLRSILDLSLLQSLLCSAGGWIILQVVGRTVGRPLLRLVEATRRWVAGTRLERDLASLLGSQEKR